MLQAKTLVFTNLGNREEAGQSWGNFKWQYFVTCSYVVGENC